EADGRQDRLRGPCQVGRDVRLGAKGVELGLGRHDRHPWRRSRPHQFASSARRSSSPNSGSSGASWLRISSTVRGAHPAAAAIAAEVSAWVLSRPNAGPKPGSTLATPVIQSAYRFPSVYATRGQTPVSPLPAS